MRSSYHILLFVLFLLFQAPTLMLGQDFYEGPEFRAIQTPRDTSGRFRHIIEFYDTTSKRLIKTVDVTPLNPFCCLPDKIIRQYADYGTPVFAIEDTSRLYFGGTKIVSDRYHAKYYQLPLQALSRYHISRSGDRDQHAIVTYTLDIYSGRTIISTHAAMLIFNSKGDLVHRSPVFDITIFKAVISTDGRFVFFVSGGPYTGEQSSFLPDQLLLYDTQSQQLTFMEDIDDAGVDIYLVNGNFFKANTHYFNKDNERELRMKVYDFYQKQKYIRIIKEEELFLILKMNDKGIFFKNEHGIPYLKYSYERDFNRSGIVMEK